MTAALRVPSQSSVFFNANSSDIFQGQKSVIGSSASAKENVSRFNDSSSGPQKSQICFTFVSPRLSLPILFTARSALICHSHVLFPLDNFSASSFYSSLKCFVLTHFLFSQTRTTTAYCSREMMPCIMQNAE